jgi:protein O-mannosyl-transferase
MADPARTSAGFPRAPDRSPWFWGGALVLLVVVAYARAVGGAFLWDDDLHVYANPVIVGPLGLKEIWTTAAANYFPLVLTNFWVQHALWGLNPVGYHLVTLAFHAGAALLLWRLLRQLRVPGAWLGAALWALHPVQVESVAWICELKNTQSAVFFLLAIHFYLRWRKTSPTSAQPGGSGRESPAGAARSAPVIAGSRDYWLALACAVAALLSKPSTVMLPVALVLVRWWQLRRMPWGEAKWLAPFFALSAGMSGWTIWEQKFHSGAIGAAWSQTWLERCTNAGRIIWFYLGKLLWPEQLTFIYPRWTPEASRALAYVPLLLAGAGLAWLWWRRQRAGAAFFAAGFFVTLLFPVLGFFDVYFFRFSFVGDHFQYLASIGPLVLFAAGLAMVSGRLFPIAGGVAVLALTTLTAVQCGDYRDPETLWRATVQRNPTAAMAWVHLGDLHARAGRHREAVDCFQRALRVAPDNAQAHNNLGCEYLLAGRLDDAIAELQRAVTLNPELADAHSNLGVALVQSGRAQEALNHYAIALRSPADAVEARYNLAKALQALGRLPEAIADYETVQQARPDYPGLQNSLGLALVDANRSAEAVPHFEAALRARPDDPNVHFNFANALNALGRGREALAHYDQAIRLEPGRAESHAAFGAALAAAGRTAEAVAQFERALQLDPALAPTHNGLGVTLAQSGQMTAALVQFDAAVRLDPNYAAAHLNRGGALAALGRAADAREAFARAVELQPGSAPAHNYLAQVLRALGREDEARIHFETAARLQAAPAPRP